MFKRNFGSGLFSYVRKLIYLQNFFSPVKCFVEIKSQIHVILWKRKKSYYCKKKYLPNKNTFALPLTYLIFLFRFLLYNLFYKRILVVWIVTAFIILLGILFGTKKQGLTMFGLGVAWLIMNAAAIFLCMWVKLKVVQIKLKDFYKMKIYLKFDYFAKKYKYFLYHKIQICG